MLLLRIVLLLAVLCMPPISPSNPCLRSQAPPAPTTGYCVHYAKDWGDWLGPAEAKTGIAARQGVVVLPGETPLAYWDCSMLNQRGRLRIAGRTIPVIVADCTAPQDLSLVRQARIVGELPWPAAERLGLTRVGKMECSLLLFPPAMLWLTTSRWPGCANISRNALTTLRPGQAAPAPIGSPTRSPKLSRCWGRTLPPRFLCRPI